MSLFENASLIITPNGRKAGKLFSLKPFNGSGDLTVVRATTATYVGADGLIKTALANEVRFDYTNGSCPSILVEPQRTNLAKYSDNFSNATWSKIRATITSNATTAPDGTLTADKLILSIDNNTHFIQQSGISVTAQIYSATIYAKKAEYDTVRILLANYWAPTPSVTFNLTTKSIESTQSATAKITELNDGWFKLDITATINAAAGGNAYFSIYGGNNGIVNLAGDGTSGIYIWGAQLEAGANATSYIPTVASAVTRNADVISKTGISDLIGQTEGTIFWNGNLSVNANERRLLSIIGTAGESQRIMIWTLNNLLYTTFNGESVNLGSFPIGTTKIAIGYTISGANTTYSIKVNNNTLKTGTASATPTSLSSIALGSQLVASLTLNDRINSTILWKERLTDTELAQLTTI